MAEPLISVYKENADIEGTPSINSTDGIPLSTEDRLIVKTIRVNSFIDEISPPHKMAIRCKTGYRTADNTIIKIVGDHKDMWALARDKEGSPDIFGEWGALLSLSSIVDDKNTIFWIKAKAVNTELPMVDTCCSLEVSTSITMVV